MAPSATAAGTSRIPLWSASGALLAQRNPRLSRAALSRAVCKALDWRKPDGGLKDMSARVALLRMQRDGLLTLQPSSRPKPLLPSPRTDPPSLAPRPVSLAETRPLRLSVLRPSDPRSRLWNEYIQRYHYLGHKPLPGAQLRYFVHADDGLLLALPGFGAAAWKTLPATNSSAGIPPPASAPAAGRQSRPLSHPALDSPPLSGIASARLPPAPTARALAATL